MNILAFAMPHMTLEDLLSKAMVRLVLTVAARGDVVIVGRGAGYVLPAETTLHARVVAPFESRVSHSVAPQAELFDRCSNTPLLKKRTRQTKAEFKLLWSLIKSVRLSRNSSSGNTPLSLLIFL